MTTLAASLVAIVELPYAYDALEPYVSAETLHFHHDKHYAGYVAKLAELTEGTRYADMSLEEIVRSSDGAIFNNAAQALNHVIYFEQLAPKAKHRPSGRLLRAIDERFGSLDELKKRMTNMATTLFGSGWVWLCLNDVEKLEIGAYPNGDTPLRHGKLPLLGFDVWEHAYYLDYQNRRADHIGRLWEIIDWDEIARRFE